MLLLQLVSEEAAQFRPESPEDGCGGEESVLINRHERFLVKPLSEKSLKLFFFFAVCEKRSHDGRTAVKAKEG